MRSSITLCIYVSLDSIFYQTFSMYIVCDIILAYIIIITYRIPYLYSVMYYVIVISLVVNQLTCSIFTIVYMYSVYHHCI